MKVSRTNRLLFAFAFALLLSGCAAVGVFSQSDPAIKLADADVLFSERGRPIPAERLFREAMDIYRERGDLAGQAKAYQLYGELLQSPAVARMEKSYRRTGFLDRSISFDDRAAKASEHFATSVSLFQKDEQQAREAGDYHRVATSSYHLGLSYYLLKDRDGACGSFDRASEAYDEFLRRNPDVKPESNPEAARVDKTISGVKKHVGCP